VRFNQVRLGDPPVKNKRRWWPPSTAGINPPLQLTQASPLALAIAFPAGASVQLGQVVTQTAPIGLVVSFPAGATLTKSLTQHQPLSIVLKFFSAALLKQRPFTIFVNGIDRTPYVLANSINIKLSLSQASTANFGLWDPAGDPSVIPQVGQQVQIYRLKVLLFGGTVEQPVQAAYQANKGHLFSGSGGAGSGGVESATGGAGAGSGGVQCTDFSNLLDRRYVGKSYPGTQGNFMSTIVADIVNTYFASDDLVYDESDGDPGINLGPQIFNWVTARQAFNTLSTLTGWNFNVDAYKVLRFFPAGSGSGPAPFNVADNDGNTLAESLSVEYYRGNYRNRQGVRSPALAAALWSDTFSAANPGPFPNEPQPPGNGRRLFGTLYDFVGIPQVTVNGVPQLVINLEVDPITTPGAKWYVLLDPTTNIGYGVSQVQSNPPLGTGDVLVVSYQTQLAPIYWVQNDAQIAARAAIEGNSGIYEDVQDAPNTITDPTAIILYAQSLLDRYGSQGIPFQVTYSTDDILARSLLLAAITPGQLQNITMANPLLAVVAGLISDVQISDVDLQYFQYSITLLSGQYQGNWVQFFAALAAQAQLPSPSAQNQYGWPIAPTIPGLSNPGVTGGYATPQVNIVNNAAETILSFRVNMPTANTGIVQFTLLVNGSGIGALAITFQPGETGTKVAYGTVSNVFRLYAGDLLAVDVTGGAISPAITDAFALLLTSVAAT
jgi:hypothetical protein